MNEILSFIITREIPVYNKIAVLVINFSAAVLLLIVFNHNKLKDIQSKIFMAMGAFILLWVDFAYLARIAGFNHNLSLFFLRIAWIATPPVFYTVYLTSVLLVEKFDKYKKASYSLLILSLILSAATASTNLIISDVKFTGSTLDIVYGVGFYPFLVAIFAVMAFTVIPMLHVQLKNNTKIFLIGVLIFYVANLIFNITLPVFLGITHYYFFGDYSTIILLGMTAYAIIRHGLFDIKVVTTELLTFIIWIILLIKLFTPQSTTDTIVDSLTLTLMVIFGILLVRSVIKEVDQRRKLQELTQKLRELDKQKDEFLSVAAHELRSPLTAIKGYLSMVIEGDTGEISDKAKSFLLDSTSVTERLIRLVNNMLNVSRIEEGRIVYQLENVDLIKAVQEVYFTFRFEAERKGLEIKLTVPDGVRDNVMVDPDRIKEVVGNFLSNAVKFTEEGKVDVKIGNPTPESVKVEIADTGPGISESEQNKLFSKFYRAESTEGKTMGTGLGLYITKLLVEEFGGKIGLESELGKGSTFWFELPLVKAT